MSTAGPLEPLPPALASSTSSLREETPRTLAADLDDRRQQANTTAIPRQSMASSITATTTTPPPVSDSDCAEMDAAMDAAMDADSSTHTHSNSNSVSTLDAQTVIDMGVTPVRRTGFKRANSNTLESSGKSRTKHNSASTSFDYTTLSTLPPTKNPLFMASSSSAADYAETRLWLSPLESLPALDPHLEYFADHAYLRHLPEVRVIDTSELILFLKRHYNTPLPDVDKMFPWLHGIHRNNYAQLQFLGSQEEPEREPDTSTPASSSCVEDCKTTLEDDLQNYLGTTSVPTGVRNLMVVRSCNSRGEVSSEYSDIITESTGLIRGTVSADDILVPVAAVLSSLAESDASEHVVIELELYLRSIFDEREYALGDTSIDTILEDCLATRLVPVFKDMDPQVGVSLRNFHIQVAKMSNLSDLMVYCFNKDHCRCVDEASSPETGVFDFSATQCKCVSLARLLHIAQILYAEEHPEIRPKDQRRLGLASYHTFLVRDPSQKRMDDANLLAIPVMTRESSTKTGKDLCTQYDMNVFNNWDSNYLYRERLEISMMSTATPICARDVWLGNVTDIECLNIRSAKGDVFANTHYDLPPVPLHCDPSNTIVTLTRRELELKGNGLHDLDARIITSPKTHWRFFVRCFEGARFPELGELENLFNTEDDIEQVDLEFPPSGSLTLADMSEEDILSLVNICKFCFFHCTQNFPALFYCSDGYTETSLLAASFVIFSEHVSLDEALIRLHVHYKRPFFLFKTDYILLGKLEPVLHAFSPVGKDPELAARFENDTSKIKAILLSPNRPQMAVVGQSGDYAGSFVTGTGHHVVEMRGRPDPEDTSVPTTTTMTSASPLASVMGSLPSQILPHMYLGSLTHACSLSMLASLGINYIVSVGERVTWMDNLNYTTAVTESDCEIMSFEPGQVDHVSGDECHVAKVMRINDICDDGIGTLTTTINDALKFIDRCYQEGGKVLVHCQVGVSRSATVCIAEVMRRLCISLPRAYMFVRVRRLNVIIQPNLKLMYELFKWEEEFVKLRRIELAKKKRVERTHRPVSSSISSSQSLFSGSERSGSSQTTLALGSPKERERERDRESDMDTVSSDSPLQPQRPLSLDTPAPVVSNTPDFMREVDWCILCREIFNLNRAYIKQPSY